MKQNMDDGSLVVGKTIREIADEIGVTKQAVFKKINRQPLSTKLTVVDDEMLIKQQFLCKNAEKSVNQTSLTAKCYQANRQPLMVCLTVCLTMKLPFCEIKWRK